mgnify:CR=1 FL=1
MKMKKLLAAVLALTMLLALAACGTPVTYLKRLSMGPLTLDPALPAGAWRPLTPEEKASLGR